MSILYILLEPTASYLHVSESMGLRGKLDLCRLQLPKSFLISPSSNLHWQNSIELTARIILGQKTLGRTFRSGVSPVFSKDVLFSSQPEISKLHETQSGAGFTAGPVFHLSVCRADWKSWVAI